MIDKVHTKGRIVSSSGSGGAFGNGAEFADTAGAPVERRRLLSRVRRAHMLPVVLLLFRNRDRIPAIIVIQFREYSFLSTLSRGPDNQILLFVLVRVVLVRPVEQRRVEAVANPGIRPGKLSSRTVRSDAVEVSSCGATDSFSCGQFAFGGQVEGSHDLLGLVDLEHVQALASTAPWTALETEPTLNHAVTTQVSYLPDSD